MSDKKRLKTRKDFEKEYYDYMKQIFKGEKIPSPRAWWISDKVEKGTGFFTNNEVSSISPVEASEKIFVAEQKTIHVPFDIDGYLDHGDPAPKGVKKIKRLDSNT